MRIRRLDVVGFKSFMDRTVVVFDDGVTGVVGPNGCGKSNVADAIRWVLGEQSARQLRGRSMEDVIFNGSESKPPLSVAEVILTFVNDRPSELPAAYQGFGEITVGRRLYRTGESEYLVNGVQARLLDVNDIFFGSGIGRTAYSIVEQGRIGQIVSARPEDRRAIIEEAAGITKYKKRREAAERKMEATQQNLTRVADLVAGAGQAARQPQPAGPPRREVQGAQGRDPRARAARRRGPLPRADRHPPRRRGAPRRGQRWRRPSWPPASPSWRRRSRPTGCRLGRGRGARSAALTGREHELASAARVSEVSVEAAARELEQIAERTRAQAGEVEALKAQAEALAGEREALERQRDDLTALSTADDVRLGDAEVALRELGRDQGLAQGEADQARTEAAAALSEATGHRSQLAQIERQRLDARTRLDRNRAEAGELADRTTRLDGSRSEFAEKLGQTRQLKLRLEEQRGAQEELLERTRSEFIQNEAKLITLREELQDKRSRLNTLLEVLRNYEGYGRGVRSIMTRAGQGEGRDRGIFGLVADVVSSAPEFESAIEAVLGERLQYVIVESHAQGVEAIDYLKTAAEGRASLIPMARLARPGGLAPRDAPATRAWWPAPSTWSASSPPTRRWSASSSATPSSCATCPRPWSSGRPWSRSAPWSPWTARCSTRPAW